MIDDGITTLWTPAADTGLDFPGQLFGQEGLEAPSWIGSTRLLLSRDVTDADPDVATFTLYDTANGDDSSADWFNDDASETWATGYDAAAARAGTRVAIVEDDAADNAGNPTRVTLRLFTRRGAHVRLRAPAARGRQLQRREPELLGRRHAARLGAEGRHPRREPRRPVRLRGDQAAHDRRSRGHAALLVAVHAGDLGDGARRQRTPPAKLTLKVSVRDGRKRLLGKGILVRVTCNAACAPRAMLRLGTHTARRAGTRRIAAHRLQAPVRRRDDDDPRQDAPLGGEGAAQAARLPHPPAGQRDRRRRPSGGPLTG